MKKIFTYTKRTIEWKNAPKEKLIYRYANGECEVFAKGFWVMANSNRIRSEQTVSYKQAKQFLPEAFQ